MFYIHIDNNKFIMFDNKCIYMKCKTHLPIHNHVTVPTDFLSCKLNSHQYNPMSVAFTFKTVTLKLGNVPFTMTLSLHHFDLGLKVPSV